MAYGTDHWFITPSIWNQIPNERKNKFLDELHSSEYDITHICPYSIFDDIRKVAIQINERLIEDEKNKITEYILIIYYNLELCHGCDVSLIP